MAFACSRSAFAQPGSVLPLYLMPAAVLMTMPILIIGLNGKHRRADADQCVLHLQTQFFVGYTGVLQPCTDKIDKSPYILTFDDGDITVFPNSTANRFEVDFCTGKTGRVWK